MPSISVARALGAARRRPAPAALLLLAGCLAWPSVDVAAEASGVPQVPQETPPMACRAGPVGYPGGARAVPGGSAYANRKNLALLRADGTIAVLGGTSFCPGTLGGGFVDICSSEDAFAALHKNGTICQWWPGSDRGCSGKPAGSDFVAVYSTEHAFAALRKDGTIATWGDEQYGGESPSGYVLGGKPLGSDFIAVYSNARAFAALRKNGSIAAWGGMYSGYPECTVTNFGGTGGEPAESGYVAVYSTESAFAALHKNGTIYAWGSSGSGGSGEPAGNDFVAVYSTRYAFAARRKDGTIAAWGSSGYGGGIKTEKDRETDGGGSDAPAGTDFVAVYSTEKAFAALHKNGTIAAWGDREHGGSAPVGSDFIAVSSNVKAFAALRKDGTIAAWGSYYYGGGIEIRYYGGLGLKSIKTETDRESDAPAGSGFVAVYATVKAFAALHKNGSIYAWGSREHGGSAPVGSGFIAVYSTHDAFAALRKDGTFATWGNIGSVRVTECRSAVQPRGAPVLPSGLPLPSGLRFPRSHVSYGGASPVASRCADGPATPLNLSPCQGEHAFLHTLPTRPPSHECLSCTGPRAKGLNQSKCECAGGYAGGACRYSDLVTCNGNGVADDEGRCTCAGPETGLGPTCSEYTNAKTCSGNGVTDAQGRCTCDGPETGLGPTCSEYTNKKTCDGKGTMSSDNFEFDRERTLGEYASFICVTRIALRCSQARLFFFGGGGGGGGGGGVLFILPCVFCGLFNFFFISQRIFSIFSKSFFL